MELLSQLSLMKVLNKITDMVFIMEVEEQNLVRYVFANEATNIGTKFSPEQVVGKTVEEVFQSDYEMGSFILGKYQQVIQQRQSITYQHIFAASSGKTVYTETKLDPLINEEGKLTHIIAVIRDMTEFIQRQGEIQEKNALLEEIEYHYDSIIEHNTDAVWFIDKDGELVRANKTFRNLLGASTDIELRELKEMCIKVFEPEELEKVRSHHNKVIVVFNIIKNAMESMENKGKLFVQTENRDAYVVIIVKDEGCGITKEKLGRLGEPFYSNKEKGTGLGLMICFKIIEEHKGKIEVKSEVGKGTTVTIYLPI